MPRERNADKRHRAEQVLAELDRGYPDAATELDFTAPFELLVATILSAQATDVSVNAATPALFQKYPDAPALAAAAPDHPESRLAAATAALHAELWGKARAHLAPLLAEDTARELRLRAARLMADIEQAENGDSALAIKWLKQAVEPAAISARAGAAMVPNTAPRSLADIVATGRERDSHQHVS